MKILFSIFLFFKKNRMPRLFNSCAVTENKIKGPRSKKDPSFTVRLRRIHFSFESHEEEKNACAAAGSMIVCRLVWPVDPGQGFTVRDNNPPSWLVAVFSLNCKNMCEAEAPLCSREKKAIIYYSNEMRSGRWWKRGRRLVAENLLLSTSVISLSPWRNKKFKGNQRSWRVSLAYFQWATLEAEVGELGCIPCRNSMYAVYTWYCRLHLHIHLQYTEYTWGTLLLPVSERPWFQTI